MSMPTFPKNFPEKFMDSRLPSSPCKPGITTSSSSSYSAASAESSSIAETFQAEHKILGGVNWSQAETAYLRLKGAHRTRIYTLPEFPPGYEQETFPSTLPEIGVRPSRSGERAQFKSKLISTYDACVADENWAYALRCAITAEMIRRTSRVHTSRGEPAISEFESHGGVYHAAAELPLPPVELKPIFHSIDYGSSPREIGFMQAVGVQPVPGCVAGFECTAPMHVVVRTRNVKSKRNVNVPGIIAKACIVDGGEGDDLETLVRGCRKLVETCDRYDDECSAISPLYLLELHVLACIPSGRLHLPSHASGTAHYEHLFGVLNDTRHFWLTSYHTDRAQYPCAIVDTSVFVAPDVTPVEPRRLTAMARVEAADDQRAMFQCMLGLWGIDRMTVGRTFAWRPRATSASDDLSIVEEVGIYPQWLPQCLSSHPFYNNNNGGYAVSPSLPPTRPSSPPSKPAENSSGGLGFFDGLDSDILSALDLPPRPPTGVKTKKRVTFFRSEDDEDGQPPPRQRSRRGSGRLVILEEPILKWAKASLASGVVEGGSCESVCVQDPAGVQPRWRYTITPGIVVGIVDAIVRQAVTQLNESRSYMFTSASSTDSLSMLAPPPLPPPQQPMMDYTTYPASSFPLPPPPTPVSPPPPPPTTHDGSSAGSSPEDDPYAADGILSSFFLREQSAKDEADIWDDIVARSGSEV
jgi:hypothetical protein